MPRTACRSRRDTRCRSTAEPTDLATINPTRGPASHSPPRRTCTTRSGCAVRTPYFTAASNSRDRLMRLRAGSTANKPVVSDQADSARRPLRRRPDTIARPARVRMRKRKPCTRARRRLFGWKVRLPLATAFSSFCLARSFPSHPAVHVWFTRVLRDSVGKWSCCWPARSPSTYFLGRSRIADFRATV
jgi:hypothetical protein